MLIRCVNPHKYGELEFAPGTVYEIDDEAGRRLLQDFGRGSRHQARHQEVRFEKVLVAGDTIQIVENGTQVDHTVTEDEAYDGPVTKVTPEGMVEPKAPRRRAATAADVPTEPVNA